MEWILGAAGSGIIAGAAYRRGSLSGSGVFAAVLVGTILYALGSPVWFGLMIGFFVTSTLLTKWKHHKKKEAESVYQKTGRRDAGQVLANGGLGTVLCAVHAGWPNTDWPLLAYIGVIATVTADTWATEIGGLSKGLPRSIVTWRRVSKGTSGGVSILGWMAAAAGAGLIGSLTILFSHWDERFNFLLFQRIDDSAAWVVLTAMVAGWLGANADSLLGATAQAVYSCEVCGREVESPKHCGTSIKRVRGWSRLDNDAVNLVSSVLGGIIFVLVASLMGN